MNAIKNAKTFMRLAIGGGDARCVNFINTHTDFYNTVASLFEMPQTPLIYACRFNLKSSVKQLLAGKADPNQYVQEWSPLFEACSINGSENIALELINNGADINKKYGSWSLLHSACNRNYKQVVKYLIDAKTDVNSVTAHENTPLDIAILAKHHYIAIMLIENGANFVDKVDKITHHDDKLRIYVRNIYIHFLHNIMNSTDGNILSVCFQTTRFIAAADIIAGYIL
ncbi:MAG: hypothetical protein Faunusvirus45_6 [Faunusvirus sp.]|jgi:ankyrin repeat protein|uniref:Uncharacterized protein n=1 Tax=Faunusvirus sp. TaxID=2487766 RepID=A0A3G4ZXW0_9VIRU|nr:MAG: hypothetical protein Faunusvirus45_6 [Faunusvirus sp.]